eukprot:10257455-Lingulodinium_polyedra.AAC.1
MLRPALSARAAPPRLLLLGVGPSAATRPAPPHVRHLALLRPLPVARLVPALPLPPLRLVPACLLPRRGRPCGWCQHAFCRVGGRLLRLRLLRPVP